MSSKNKYVKDKKFPPKTKIVSILKVLWTFDALFCLVMTGLISWLFKWKMVLARGAFSLPFLSHATNWAFYFVAPKMSIYKALFTIFLCLFSIPIDGVTFKCNHNNLETKGKYCEFSTQSSNFDGFNLKMSVILTSF